MKLLTLKIDNCAECPYCERHYREDFDLKPTAIRCKNLDRNIVAAGSNADLIQKCLQSVPDWCILEDV